MPAELAYLWYLPFSDALCEAEQIFNGFSTFSIFTLLFQKSQENIGYYIILLPIKTCLPKLLGSKNLLYLLACKIVKLSLK